MVSLSSVVVDILLSFLIFFTISAAISEAYGSSEDADPAVHPP